MVVLASRARNIFYHFITPVANKYCLFFYYENECFPGLSLRQLLKYEPNMQPKRMQHQIIFRIFFILFLFYYRGFHKSVQIKKNLL